MKPYFSFQWHITDECDQRCKHCYIFSAGDHTCLKSMTWSEIADPSDSGLAVGQKVAALMGGMGRSFNGSYAEYALLPGKIVFTIESDLPWEALGAVPETCYTAWGSLFECLHLTADDTLLIRGATCALGYAAIQIARALGCKVIATTHREEKLPLLAETDEALLDNGRLTGRVYDFEHIRDAVIAQDEGRVNGKIVVRM